MDQKNLIGAVYPFSVIVVRIVNHFKNSLLPRNTKVVINHRVVVVVVVLGFYVPPTAKVIWRRDLGLKSHPNDWRSPGSNSGPLVYKAGSLTARPRRLLKNHRVGNLILSSILSYISIKSLHKQVIYKLHV